MYQIEKEKLGVLKQVVDSLIKAKPCMFSFEEMQIIVNSVNSAKEIIPKEKNNI